MYTTYPIANPTAIITKIITDHTGSAGLSKGLNIKFTIYFHSLQKELIDMPSYLSIH